MDLVVFTRFTFTGCVANHCVADFAAASLNLMVASCWRCCCVIHSLLNFTVMKDAPTRKRDYSLRLLSLVLSLDLMEICTTVFLFGCVRRHFFIQGRIWPCDLFCCNWNIYNPSAILVPICSWLACHCFCHFLYDQVFCCMWYFWWLQEQTPSTAQRQSLVQE